MRRALIVLAVLLISCGPVDLGRAIQQLQPVADEAAVTSEIGADAVKQVIERANEAQQKAFVTGDLALMRETATAAYFDELRQINTDLARGGVMVSASSGSSGATSPSPARQPRPRRTRP